jgi:hypothetical protein
VYTGGEFNLGRSLDHLHDIDIELSMLLFWPFSIQYPHAAPLLLEDVANLQPQNQAMSSPSKLSINTLFIFFPRNCPFNPEGKISQQLTEGCRIVRSSGINEKSTNPFTFPKMGFSQNKC